MAITVSWLQNNGYSAQLDRQVIEAMVPAEGVASPLSFKVVPQSPAAFSVKVLKGGAFIKGDNTQNQGMYYADSNDDEALAMAALPPSGYKRIDSVCLRVRDPDASGPAGNDATLVVVQGTQAVTSGTASPPALPDTHLRLANISLTSTSSAITTSEIANTRTLCGGLDHVGTIQEWAGDGSILPTGWMLCDGSAISRTTYAELFEVCGVIHGAGDNSTTFNIPDHRGRCGIGAGAGGGLTARALGQKIGVESVALGAAEMPAHVHNMSHGHGNAVTDAQGQHTHALPSLVGVGAGTNSFGIGMFTSGGDRYFGSDPAGNHAHNVTVPAFSGNTGSVGGGGAHQNMQPSIAVNFIIRVV